MRKTTILYEFATSQMHRKWVFRYAPKKIKTIIQRCERDFANEEDKYGSIHGGNGNRYLIGPLYMILGDNAKATQ